MNQKTNRTAGAPKSSVELIASVIEEHFSSRWGRDASGSHAEHLLVAWARSALVPRRPYIGAP